MADLPRHDLLPYGVAGPGMLGPGGGRRGAAPATARARKEAAAVERAAYAPVSSKDIAEGSASAAASAAAGAATSAVGIARSSGAAANRPAPTAGGAWGGSANGSKGARAADAVKVLDAAGAADAAGEPNEDVTASHRAPLIKRAAHTAPLGNYEGLTSTYDEARLFSRTDDRVNLLLSVNAESPYRPPCCCGRVSYRGCAAIAVGVVLALAATAYTSLRFGYGPNLAQSAASNMQFSMTNMNLTAIVAGAGAGGLPTLTATFSADPVVSGWSTWYAAPEAELSSVALRWTLLDLGEGVADFAAACASAAKSTPATASEYLLGSITLPALTLSGSGAVSIPLADASLTSLVAPSLSRFGFLGMRDPQVCLRVSTAPGTTAQLTVSVLPGVSGFLRHTYDVTILSPWVFETGSAVPVSQAIGTSFAVEPTPADVPYYPSNDTTPLWITFDITFEYAKNLGIANIGCFVDPTGKLPVAGCATGAQTTYGDVIFAIEYEGQSVVARLYATELSMTPGDDTVQLLQGSNTWRFEGPILVDNRTATDEFISDLADSVDELQVRIHGYQPSVEQADPDEDARNSVWAPLLEQLSVFVPIPRRMPPLVEGLHVSGLGFAPVDDTHAAVDVNVSFVIRNPLAFFTPVEVQSAALAVNVSSDLIDLGELILFNVSATQIPMNSSMYLRDVARSSPQDRLRARLRENDILPCEDPTFTQNETTAYACVAFVITGHSTVDLVNSGAQWASFLRTFVEGTTVNVALGSNSKTAIALNLQSVLGPLAISAPMETVSTSLPAAQGFAIVGDGTATFTASTPTFAALAPALAVAVANPSAASFDFGENTTFSMRATDQFTNAPSAVVGILVHPHLTIDAVRFSPTHTSVPGLLVARPNVTQVPVVNSFLSAFVLGQSQTLSLLGLGAAMPNASASAPPPTAENTWIANQARDLAFTVPIPGSPNPTTLTSTTPSGFVLDFTQAATTSALLLGGHLDVPLQLPLPLGPTSISTLQALGVSLVPDASANVNLPTVVSSFAQQSATTTATSGGVAGTLGLTIPVGTPVVASPAPASLASSQAAQFVANTLLTASAPTTVSGLVDAVVDTPVVAPLTLHKLPFKAATLTPCGHGMNLKSSTSAAVSVVDVTFSSTSAPNSLDATATAGLNAGLNAGANVFMNVPLTIQGNAACDTRMLLDEVTLSLRLTASDPTTEINQLSIANLVLEGSVSVQNATGPVLQTFAADAKSATGAARVVSATTPVSTVLSAYLAGQSTTATLVGTTASSTNPVLQLAVSQLSFPVVLPPSPATQKMLFNAWTVNGDGYLLGQPQTDGSVTLNNPFDTSLCIFSGSITASTSSAAGANLGATVTLFTAPIVKSGAFAFLPARAVAQTSDLTASIAIPAGDDLPPLVVLRSIFGAAGANALTLDSLVNITLGVDAATCGQFAAAYAANQPLPAGTGALVAEVHVPQTAVPVTFTHDNTAHPMFTAPSVLSANLDVTDPANPTLAAHLQWTSAWVLRAGAASTSITSLTIDNSLLPGSGSTAVVGTWTAEAASAAWTPASVAPLPPSGLLLDFTLPATVVKQTSAASLATIASNAVDAGTSPFALQSVLTLAVTARGVSVTLPNVPITGPTALTGLSFGVKGGGSSMSLGGPSIVAVAPAPGGAPGNAPGIVFSGTATFTDPTTTTLVVPAPLLFNTVNPSSGTGQAPVVGTMTINGGSTPSPVTFAANGVATTASYQTTVTDPAFLTTVLSNHFSMQSVGLAVSGRADTTANPLVAGGFADVENAFAALPGSPVKFFNNVTYDATVYLADGTAPSPAQATVGFVNPTSVSLTVQTVNFTILLCPTSCGGSSSSAACCAAAGNGVSVATWAQTVGAVLPPTTGASVLHATTVSVVPNVTMAATMLQAIATGQNGMAWCMLTGSATLTFADGPTSVTLTIPFQVPGVPLMANNLPSGSGSGTGSGSGNAPVDPTLIAKFVDAFATQARQSYSSQQFHGYFDGFLGLSYDLAVGGPPGLATGEAYLPVLFFMHTNPNAQLNGNLLPDAATFTNIVGSNPSVPASGMATNNFAFTGIADFRAEVEQVVSTQRSTPTSRYGKFTNVGDMNAVKSQYFNAETALALSRVEFHAYDFDITQTWQSVRVHPFFAASIGALPNDYADAGSIQAWNNFLTQYGTDFTVRVVSGGFIESYNQFDYGLLQSNGWGPFTLPGVQSQVETYLESVTGISASTGQPIAPPAVDATYAAHNPYHGTSCGGGNPAFCQETQPAQWAQWINTVPTAPMMVQTQTIPLWELVNTFNPTKGAALQAAAEAYLASTQNAWNAVANCPTACGNGACAGSADACTCTNGHQFGRLCQLCISGWLPADCTAPDCSQQGHCNPGHGNCVGPEQCSCDSCYAGSDCSQYTCGGCFAGETRVLRERLDRDPAADPRAPASWEEVPLSAVSVGDRLASLDPATGNVVFSDVYHLRVSTHPKQVNETELVQIETEQGTRLALTPEHLLYVHNPALDTRAWSNVTAMGTAHVEVDAKTGGISGGVAGAVRRAREQWASAFKTLPAAWVQPKDWVLVVRCPSPSDCQAFPERVRSVDLSRDFESVVTVHTLAGPVVANGVVASSFECSAEQGYWDTADLRAVYHALPSLAQSRWFQGAVRWLDDNLWMGAPELASWRVAVSESLAGIAAGARGADVDEAVAAGAAAPAKTTADGSVIPQPFCPFGTRTRGEL